MLLTGCKLYLDQSGHAVNLMKNRFLLAQLYLTSLSGKMSRNKIRTELQALARGSQTYDEAYDSTMRRIFDQGADEGIMALRVLSWITYAERPLTTFELQHALAVELGEPQFDEDNLYDLEDLVSVCAGLVTITMDGSKSILRLVHTTTREYFEKKLVSWLPDPQGEIGTTCITYISYDAFNTGSCATDSSFEERLEKYPLYSYAAKNWGHHIRAQPIANVLLMAFLQDPSKTDACGQAIFARRGYTSHEGYSSDVPLGTTGLHLVAYFGLAEVAALLLEQYATLSSVDSFGRTPFEWAAYSGQHEVIRLFLNKGVNAEQRGLGCRSPIALAASGGWIDTVKLLLDHGVEPDSRCRGRPAISWGASEGHRDVVQLLLERGAKPDAKDDDGRTPLLQAAGSGWSEIVLLLLERGCDPDSPDLNGRTALSEAAENDHIAVVDVLLKAGCKVDFEDAEGKTPLWWANYYGNAETSRLLQEDVADNMSFDFDKDLGSTLGFPDVLPTPNNIPYSLPNVLPGPFVGQPPHRSDQTKFKCFCGTLWYNRGAMKRHIIERHFPAANYRCPACDMTLQGRDKMRSHMRSHGGSNQMDFIKEDLPVPQPCPICAGKTDSWQQFYRCLLRHATADIRRSSVTGHGSPFFH